MCCDIGLGLMKNDGSEIQPRAEWLTMFTGGRRKLDRSWSIIINHAANGRNPELVGIGKKQSEEWVFVHVCTLKPLVCDFVHLWLGD